MSVVDDKGDPPLWLALENGLEDIASTLVRMHRQNGVLVPRCYADTNSLLSGWVCGLHVAGIFCISQHLWHVEQVYIRQGQECSQSK